MESRKRLRTEDGEVLQSKKRAVSDSRDSPVPINGLSDPNEPKDGDSLETFRKDAIYRRMRYYARENDRSQARIAELERRRNTCEAGLAALEACWTQLLNTVRSLVKPEELQANVNTSDIFDLTAHVSNDPDPEYVEELRNKMHITEQLVTAFVQLGRKKELPLLKDETYRRCQAAETECSSLRSEVSLLHTRLRDSDAQKERYYEQLVMAEKRIDRIQSKAVASLNPDPNHTSQAGTPNEEPRSEQQTAPEETSSPVTPAPVPPQPQPQPESPVVNGDHTPESEVVEEDNSVKQRLIDDLTRENRALEAQLVELKMSPEYQLISEKLVREHQYTKMLAQRLSATEHASQEREAEITRLRVELQKHRSNQAEFETRILKSCDTSMNELRSVLARRDNDAARLREQRDQHHSELVELRQRDTIKFNSVNESKALAESRSDRISVLMSEIIRLKARLAAEAGDEDLMVFILECRDTERSYIADLKDRMIKAERRAKLAEGSQTPTRDLREKLAEATEKLKTYERLFGASPDVKSLTEQLRVKDEEITKLRLHDQERAQAEEAIYSEVDRLSSAWEALDKQVKNKIFDLSAMEERLAKLAVEKAKSENKFYAAIREKEAIELLNKSHVKELERKNKALERYSDISNKAELRAQEGENEVNFYREQIRQQRAQMERLSQECKILNDRNAADRKYLDEVRIPFNKAAEDLHRKRQDVVKLEETLNKRLREVERQATKQQSLPDFDPANASTREAELRKEVDKCMELLKCSTCKINMRNTVITKCMHSFCKNCVNERISSRQRKCPACNLPFSQGEVQQLFFQ